MMDLTAWEPRATSEQLPSMLRENSKGNHIESRESLKFPKSSESQEHPESPESAESLEFEESPASTESPESQETT